jgi:hypothetical protein
MGIPPCFKRHSLQIYIINYTPESENITTKMQKGCIHAGARLYAAEQKSEAPAFVRLNENLNSTRR